MELVYKIDGFCFYLIPEKEGFKILETSKFGSQYLKKGRAFFAKELAMTFLEKYIKQGTYKEKWIQE